jgi:hypothetical protein
MKVRNTEKSQLMKFKYELEKSLNCGTATKQIEWVTKYMNGSLIKLEPTNLYLNINTNKVDKVDGYKYLGTYCEYRFRC